MLNSITPAAGGLLISEPFMMDPNFKRSVILLTEYADVGVMGFILNHQSEYLLGDVLPDVSYSEIPVFTGGPVAANTLHFIHRAPEKIEGGIELTEGIYWGGDFEQVKELVNTYQLSETEIKFFMGYSGWTPEQLSDEIRDNSWLVTDKFNSEMLFNSNDQQMWKQVVISMGQRFAHIANFPENPQLN